MVFVPETAVVGADTDDKFWQPVVVPAEVEARKLRRAVQEELRDQQRMAGPKQMLQRRDDKFFALPGGPDALKRLGVSRLGDAVVEIPVKLLPRGIVVGVDHAGVGGVRDGSPRAERLRREDHVFVKDARHVKAAAGQKIRPVVERGDI